MGIGAKVLRCTESNCNPQQNAKDELHLSLDVCTYLSNLKISQLCGKMQRKNVASCISLQLECENLTLILPLSLRLPFNP